MHRIEIWRLEELGMLLGDLTAVLKAGRFPEWAGVFDHFSHELALIREAGIGNPSELRRLVRNIQLCFEGSSGFLHLVLIGKDEDEGAALNLRLTLLKARMTEALEVIDLRLVDRVN